MPAAKSTARSLREAKAAGEEDVWLRTLRTYATTRAGNEIVSVSGTWKDSLVSLLRSIMDENGGATLWSANRRSVKVLRC